MVGKYGYGEKEGRIENQPFTGLVFIVHEIEFSGWRRFPHRYKIDIHFGDILIEMDMIIKCLITTR